MKRILLILLSVACMSALAGCGDRNNNSNNTTTPGTSNSIATTKQEPPVTTTTERTNTLESDLGMLEDDIQNGISDVGDDMGMGNGNSNSGGNNSNGNSGGASPAR